MKLCHIKNLIWRNYAYCVMKESECILKDGRAVFNVAGNAYRIVVWINYPYRVVYIRFVGTHRMYDAIDAQTI